MSIENTLERIAVALEALVSLKTDSDKPVKKSPAKVVPPPVVETVAAVTPPPTPSSVNVQVPPVDTALVAVPPVSPPAPNMTSQQLNEKLSEIAHRLGGDPQPIFDLMNKPPFNAKGIDDLKPEQYQLLVDAANKELA